MKIIKNFQIYMNFWEIWRDGKVLEKNATNMFQSISKMNKDNYQKINKLKMPRISIKILN